MTSQTKDTPHHHHSKSSSKKKSSSSSSKKSKRRSSSSAKMDPPPDLVELDEGSNSSHSHSASSSLDAPFNSSNNAVVGPSHVAIVTILGRISSPTCTLSPKKKKNENKSRKSVRFSDNAQPLDEEEDISCQSHEFEKIQGDEAQKVWYNASEMRDMRREANLIVETLREDDDFLWATNVLYQTQSCRRKSADKVKMDRAFKILAHHHDLARGLEMHLDPTPQRTMAEHLFVVDRAQRTADRALLRKESRKGSKRTAHYASAMAELDAQEAAVAYYNCSSSS